MKQRSIRSQQLIDNNPEYFLTFAVDRCWQTRSLSQSFLTHKANPPPLPLAAIAFS